ncbi:MAG: hypothetical protein ACE5FG_11325 [Myxococcota bacterium]
MSDRDKISFSELDRRRREKRRGSDDRRPRGERARQRSRAAASRYRQKIEEKLFGKREDAARLRLEQRLRDTHGSPLFGRTFREYVKGYGMPADIPLLVTLLDLDEERDLLQVLQALDGLLADAPPEHRSLLKSRLRNLEMSTSSDVLADAAGDILARF